MKTSLRARPRLLPPPPSSSASRPTWLEAGAFAVALVLGIASLEPGRPGLFAGTPAASPPIATGVTLPVASARPTHTTPPPPASETSASELVTAARSDSPPSAPSRDFSREAADALVAPTAQRRAALNAAYFAWASRDPEAAAQSALRLAPSDDRAFAVESALSGWSHTDAPGLAAAALAFPDGAEKAAALTKALRAWLVSDPDAAGTWIAAHPAVLPTAEALIRTENR